MRALLIVMLAARAAWADYVNGAPDHVRAAEAVLLVDHGDVVEVIAGVWFEQTTTVKGRALVLVQPRELGGTAELAIDVRPRPEPIVWPLGPNDALPSDVPAEGGDGRIVKRTQLTLADIRTIAKQVRPLDVGLTPRVIATLAGTSDADATVVAAIYDLARDVPRLNLLAQSKTPAIRDAARKRLASLKHANRSYPVVPSPLAPPKVMTPTLPLDDFKKLAATLPAWLDSGPIRDRELRGATSIEKTKWPGADYGERPQTNAQWVPLGAFLDKTATNRTAAFAALVMHAHAERFALERAAAAKALLTEPPCASRVKQAAYWEPDDSYIPGPAHSAWLRLSQCNDADAIALLQLAIRLRPDAPVIAAAGQRVAAKDKAFTQRLLAHVKATGQSASWAATLLAGEPALVPIAIDWLRSKDRRTRIAGAHILERMRAASALPALVAAIAGEADHGALRMEVSALAPIADKRAFDTLMKLAKSPHAPRLPLANALARIGDKRALPTLARLALDAGDTDLQGAQEAVNAFCFLSKLCDGRAPSDQSGGAVDPDYIRRGRDTISKWRP
jgi:HEAT repeat protein